MKRWLLFALFAFSQPTWAQSSCLQIFRVEDPLFQGLPVQTVEVLPPQQVVRANSELLDLNAKSADLAQQLTYKADTSKVSTLLYVASGYDAATPFILIPHLHRVIGVDEHPFLKASEKTVEARLPEERFPDYTSVDLVTLQGFLAPAILGRLYEAFPDLRVKSVEVISQGEKAHGRIRFDLGEGTTEREYIHIQAQMPGISGMTHTRVETPFLWGKALEATGYQAMLIKASMNVFIKNPEALELFLVPLIKNKGLLLDMDGVRLESSFDLFEMWGGTPNYSRTNLKVERYGYGSSSSPVLIPHVTQFE